MAIRSLGNKCLLLSSSLRREGICLWVGSFVFRKRMAWTRRCRQMGIAVERFIPSHAPSTTWKMSTILRPRSTSSFSDSISSAALHAANDGQTVGWPETKWKSTTPDGLDGNVAARRFYAKENKAKKKLIRLHRAPTINRSSKLCPSEFESPIPFGTFSSFARSLA